MASFKEFEAAEPDMAAFARRLMLDIGPEDAGLGYLATIRPDGGPRVHPLCVMEVDAHLYVAIEARSPKADDLRRDSRYMLHAFPAFTEDPEFSMRGRAEEITDPDDYERLRAAKSRLIGEHAPHVFRLDIDRADTTEWHGWPDPGMRAERRKWTAR